MDLYTELYTLLKNYDIGTAPAMDKKSIVVVPPKQAVLYKMSQSRNWHVRIKYNDQPGYWKKSTGTPNFEQAKAKAIEWHMLINSDHKEIGDIFRAKTFTIKDVANEFLKKKNSNNNDKSIIENHIIPKIGHITIQRLKYTDLENYIIECNVKSKSTFDNHKATLLKLFRYSIQQQYISNADHLRLNHNDFKHNFEKSERDSITQEEWKIIVDNWDDWISKARTKRAKLGRELLYYYARIIIHSGIRPGKELSEVECSHLTIETDKIIYPAMVSYKGFLKIASGKVSKLHKRTIPITHGSADPFAMVIMKHKANDPNFESYLENNPKEKIFYIDNFLPDYSKMFGNYISELKEEGKIKEDKNITLYSLRSTFITNELQKKRDIYSLAKYCGTSVKMIEDHYSKHKSIIESEEIFENQTEKYFECGFH